MPKTPKLPEFPLNGLFPIEKPSGIPSMKVIDSIKPLLASSNLFADPNVPLTPDEIRRRNRHKGGLKIGQGGTLDPLADGVLVIGVGKGTKHLGQFLNCTKVRVTLLERSLPTFRLHALIGFCVPQSYTTTAILGCSTTTYDSEGAVLSLAPWEHVTRELIEGALDKFKGDIMQVPPIFSALKMDGKPLYEYARESIPLPRPIASRPSTVSHLALLSFTPAEIIPGDGGHSYDFPKERLSEEEKKVFKRLGTMAKEAEEREKAKEAEGAGGGNGTEERHATAAGKVLETATAVLDSAVEPKIKRSAEGLILRPPTFTLAMTVSSGTYVRSIVNDIAEAVGSAAHVVKLTRTRQGNFVLTEKGEDELDAGLIANASGSGVGHVDPEEAETKGEAGPSKPVEKNRDGSVRRPENLPPAALSSEEQMFIFDASGPDRFDFGLKKGGCVRWEVWERAIKEFHEEKKAATAAAAAAVEGDEEEQMASVGAGEKKWKPKEWEREMYARFVPTEGKKSGAH